MTMFFFLQTERMMSYSQQVGYMYLHVMIVDSMYTLQQLRKIACSISSVTSKNTGVEYQLLSMGN